MYPGKLNEVLSLKDKFIVSIYFHSKLKNKQKVKKEFGNSLDL